MGGIGAEQTAEAGQRGSSSRGGSRSGYCMQGGGRVSREMRMSGRRQVGNGASKARGLWVVDNRRFAWAAAASRDGEWCTACVRYVAPGGYALCERGRWAWGVICDVCVCVCVWVERWRNEEWVLRADATPRNWLPTAPGAWGRLLSSTATRPCTVQDSMYEYGTVQPFVWMDARIGLRGCAAVREASA